MANTIDNFTLKVNVEGTAQIKTATADIQNLDKATTTAGKNMGAAAQNIRNVGFQVQDFTVQVANGTSAITALSQQLPQLLSNFGTMGVYLGIAAAAIPLVVAGFRMFGGDTRDLDQKIKDLTDSTDRLQSAQKTNLPTLQGLGNQYGALTPLAKEFFQVQEDLLKQRATFEMTSALKSLKNDYAAIIMSSEQYKKAQEEALKYTPYAAMGGGAGTELAIRKIASDLKLSVDQAKELGSRLAEIDAASPEKTVKAINDAGRYLESLGKEGEIARETFTKIVQPILDIGNAVLKLQENMRNAAEQATKFNSEMLAIQTSFIPKIGDAKRAFDQVAAVRLEGAQKIAEFERSLQEQTAKDGVSRAGELAAFRTRINQEVLDKEKDITKQQFESAFALVRQNEARTRQLAVEAGIVQLRDRGLFDAEWNLKYDEELLKVDQTLADTLSNIEELRRKNQISQKQALTLEQQAFDLQRRGADIAAQRRDSDVRKKIIQDEMDLNKKNVEDQISARQTLDDLIRQTIDKVRESQMTPDARALTGLTSIQQKFVEIEAAARRAALEKGRVFAAKFEGDMTPERMAELARGLDQITEAERKWAEQQKELAQANYDFTRQFDSGWAQAFAAYAENASDASKRAQGYFNTFASGVEQLFLSILPNNQWSWRRFLGSLLADFLKFQAQLAVTQLAKPGGLLASLFGGGLKSLFGGIGFGTGMGFGNMDYGGFFAKGGTLGAGKWGIAGEAGPEIVSGPATITPISQMPSTTIVNYNISAVDAQSFRSLVARDPEFIYQVTEAGRRSQPSRRLA
jgi:lambda family phage tail tape measure protein